MQLALTICSFNMQSLFFLLLFMHLVFMHLLLCDARQIKCNKYQKRLNVTVLYEALCGDSRKFLLDFLPVFKEYQQCIDLTLVPFGKAIPNNNGGYLCQHGPLECKQNQLHDCVLHGAKSQLVQLKFVVCELRDMKYGQDLKCAQSVRLRRFTKKCLENGDFIQYQAESERKTRPYNFDLIPAIILDGEYDYSWQSELLSDPGNALCQILVETNRLEERFCK